MSRRGFPEQKQPIRCSSHGLVCMNSADFKADSSPLPAHTPLPTRQGSVDAQNLEAITTSPLMSAKIIYSLTPSAKILIMKSSDLSRLWVSEHAEVVDSTAGRLGSRRFTSVSNPSYTVPLLSCGHLSAQPHSGRWRPNRC